MGDTARIVAFLLVIMFLFGTFIGSVLPEFGNILATHLKYPRERSHAFNVIFLTFGIIGVMLALYLGYRYSG